MIKYLIDFIFFTLLKLDAESHIVASAHYFVYDSIKIILLLFALITVMGIIRSYISQEKFKKFLSKQNRFAGYFFASFFGAITPFCSCSSIPLFISFLELGIPTGVTFAFLTTSPIVNQYLLVLMFGLFGWKVTVAYIVFGMMVGIISGMIIDKFNLGKHIEKDLVSNVKTENKFTNFKSRIKFGIKEATDIVKKLWLWILFGVGLGAVIHNFVPQAFVETIMAKVGFISVILVVLLGIPFYGSCVAIIPIALALFQKGFPLGTALAFMMAVSGLSLPEAIILRRAMNLKLILIFFSIVGIGIIVIGYLFNILQPLLI